jgi:hypothetical protein
MDKTLREVRNELDNPKETLILKGCEQARRFLSAVGYSLEKDKGTLEKLTETFYDFYLLHVNNSLYLFYRYSEKDDLEYTALSFDEYGFDVSEVENYIVAFFRDTCSFGFALMSRQYNYLDRNDEGAEKQRLSFLKSNRDYLRTISVSDIDLSNYEEMPYLKPMASDGTSFGSRFMKKLNNLNKP